MTIELLAPAKINLGLEVIGKRDDGFHDIATVFQTVSLFDRIQLQEAAEDSVQLVEDREQIESNLAERALELLQSTGNAKPAFRVTIEKRIPIAAGMGGASADAAAILSVVGHAGGREQLELNELALRLGSDVPFLLRGGAAQATGRGEKLQPLPSLARCWFVLACPAIELVRKTPRLYGALTPADFTKGTASDRVAQFLRSNQLPAPTDLANAFEKPLAALLPEIRELPVAFAQAGAPFVALSGAGPTHYTIVETLDEALRLSQKLAARQPVPMRVIVARPAKSGLQVRRR